MSHPQEDNKTAFALAPVFVTNESAAPLLVLVIKATFEFAANPAVRLAPTQVPVKLSGEYWGDPDHSSYKYEPEGAFFKPSTDVALVGHARAPRAGTRELDVGLCLGPLEKRVRVMGDRFWVSTLGVKSATRPEPFEKIPLTYERAFGGWDRSNPNPQKHEFEPRNPVGTGFRSRRGKFEDGVRLPNLETPGLHLNSYHGRPAPAGFGFTSPNWQPRARFAGTYDEKWVKDRMPLLPKDFDSRFFNAASAGLVAPGYLLGNEPVLLENASAGGRLAFYLPGIPPPKCRVAVRGKADQDLDTKLDTVIINTDENLLFLIWRSNLVLRRGPEDVSVIEIKADGLPESVRKKQ
jgi:hypothetical protein